MKFYIAFSITSTNKFTVAEINTRFRLRNAETNDQFVKRCLGSEFSAVKSRRASYDLKEDGIKVHWTGLLSKSGNPLISPSWISRRFKELEKRGWKIVKDKHDR